MNTPVQTFFRNIPIVAAGSEPVPAIRWRPAAVPKHLMPYGAAAKAIFIRANGRAAYYRATGTAAE